MADQPDIETIRAAEAWAVTLENASAGWLLITKEGPPLLRALAARVETLEAALPELKAMADKVLAHGKAAADAGWRGDIAEGYFEDEEAGKLCYELAGRVAALSVGDGDTL
jgi:hypothetical protein